jgi:hypothetical protein
MRYSIACSISTTPPTVGTTPTSSPRSRAAARHRRSCARERITGMCGEPEDMVLREATERDVEPAAACRPHRELMYRSIV